MLLCRASITTMLALGAVTSPARLCAQQLDGSGPVSVWHKLPTGGSNALGNRLRRALVRVETAGDKGGEGSRFGSGMLIDASTVLTAAHVVPDCAQSRATVRTAWALEQPGAPLAAGKSTAVYCFAGARAFSPGQPDLAIIHLATPVAEFAPALKLQTLAVPQDRHPVRVPVAVMGFRVGDTGPAQAAYMQTAPASWIDEQHLYYRQSTAKGHSGAPVIDWSDAAAQLASPTALLPVVGVHTTGQVRSERIGASPANQIWSGGTALSADAVQWINRTSAIAQDDAKRRPGRATAKAEAR